MANIPSQIKRNARSLRERQENRQYTSSIKTYFRRLGAAVEAGDDKQADEDHRHLVKLIDKAVPRGASSPRRLASPSSRVPPSGVAGALARAASARGRDDRPHGRRRLVEPA